MNTISLSFYRELTIMCFGYHITQVFWSTDKLGINKKSTVFCMQNIVIRNYLLSKSCKPLT